MKVNIIGGGKVGIINALGISILHPNYEIIVSEIDEDRLSYLIEGKFLCEDKSFYSYVEGVEKNNNISFQSDIVDDAEVYIVCIGTPYTSEKKGFNSKPVLDLISSLNSSSQVVVRSTMGVDLLGEKKDGLILIPEFIREGTGLSDFLEPSLEIIGVDDVSTDVELLIDLFGFDNPKVVSCTEAMLIKLYNNSFHSLKVSFFNEIGRVSSLYDANPYLINEIISSDNILNMSSYYTKPGLPYGGPCLPKDTSELVRLSELKNAECKLIKSLNKSNDKHFEVILNNLVDKIQEHEKVCLVGLSFKSTSSDLRYSVPYKYLQSLVDLNLDVEIYYYNEMDLDMNFGKFKYVQTLDYREYDLIIFFHDHKEHKAGSFLSLQTKSEGVLF